MQDIIEIYLQNNVDKKLSKDEQKSFVDVCDIRDRFNRQQTSIGQIRQYLEVNYFYTVQSKRFKEKGKLVTYWIIRKMEQENKNTIIRPP